MSGYLSAITNGGATPALIASISFAQKRHAVIAENVANASTPGYKAKHLDFKAFQRALGSALDARGGDRRKQLKVSSRQVRTDANGSLQFTPQSKPGHNLVFHDGTNVSIEQEMSDLASNAMFHELSVTLLDGYFDGMRKAIRGRV